MGLKQESYLVTGLSQSIGNLGQIAALTMEGMQQLQSDYKGYDPLCISRWYIKQRLYQKCPGTVRGSYS